jgi:GntR family transcriptional regulator
VTVDPEEPTPLYRQLAAILRGQIERGELTGRVPSIKTLAETHGVAMGTAERALAILRDEGVITVVIGRGAYVKRKP